MPSRFSWLSQSESDCREVIDVVGHVPWARYGGWGWHR